MASYNVFLVTILINLVNYEVNGLPGLYLRPYNGKVSVHKFGYGYKPSEASNLGEIVPEERGEVSVPKPAKITKRNIPSSLSSGYAQSQLTYPVTEYVQPTDMYGMQGQLLAAPISQVPQEFQYTQYPHIHSNFPQTPYPDANLGYPEISGHTVYIDYLKTEPDYLGREWYHPGIYPYGHPNVQIRPAYGHGPNCIYLPSKIPTPQGEIDVELVDVRPYKPGTEPLGQVPMVKSIEVKISNGKNEKDIEETAEDNEIQSNSFRSGLFGLK